MHMNKERRAKGEAVNLGLATDCNTSRYQLLVEETGKILISNQVRFQLLFSARALVAFLQIWRGQ